MGPAVEGVVGGGGANVIQQFLAAGFVDEMNLSVVPIFLGAGERLFDNVDGPGQQLEQVRVVEAPGVVHLRYSVRKSDS